MKKIKPKNSIFFNTIILLISFISLSSCEKLSDLSFQKKYDYKPEVLDPKINMTAWEYLNQPRQDTLFNNMIKAIKYAGLEEEYSKPNRTFLLLTNVAMYRVVSNRVNVASWYWKIVGNTTATFDITKASVDEVKKLLLYHIIDGVYSYDNLNEANVQASTLYNDPINGKIFLRAGQNPGSLLADFRITINEFPGSIKPVSKQAGFVPVRTSNIQPTNGVIHVMDAYAEYGIQ